MNMGKWLSHRYGLGGVSEFGRLPLDLKRCPVCGTINSASNGECVTCSWHGSFECDPETIEDGLYEMMVRCPDLAEALLDRPAEVRRRRKVDFFGWISRLFRRRSRLDYQA